MITKALGVVSALPGPLRIGAYVAGGGVLLVGLLWAKGAYDGRIERMQAIRIAKEVDGVSAETLIADLKHNREQAKAAMAELANHRAEEDERARALDAKEEALERERANFEARQKRALGEYTRRLGEIRPKVDAIPDEDLDAEWRAAVAALEGGR